MPATYHQSDQCVEIKLSHTVTNAEIDRHTYTPLIPTHLLR